MPHVGIIIVNFNGESETRECLLSLKKIVTDGLKVSVVVVDNGSRENLSIPEKDLPAHTNIIRSDANLGFSEGNNLGLKYLQEHTKPDYILLLNNDTVVEPNFLVELVKCLEKNPKAGAATPKIYFSPGREFHSDSYLPEQLGKVFWYAGGSIDWLNLDAFHRGVDEVDRGQFDNQNASIFATGCCVLIPMRIIEQLGLFDTGYFLYLEDVDLSMKIRQAGYQLHFCPVSIVWHKNAGSSGGAGSTLHQYYQTRNRLFFFFKYGRWRTRLTVLKFSIRLLISGTVTEKKGVGDWMLNRMGKQPVA